MISIEIFLFGLLIVSTLTSLFTEAIKKMLADRSVQYHSNTIAGVVSVLLSCAIGISYMILSGFGFTAVNIIYLVALVVMSWLCSMVGYDKVMQAISQFKTYGKDGKSE